MHYAIADLVELTGVAPRTIRSYIEGGLVPRPDGIGPAAVYREEHVVRLKTVALMRKQGSSVQAVKAEIAGWSPARCKRWLAQNEPEVEPEAAPVEAAKAAATTPAEPPAPATPPAPPRAADHAIDGEPVSNRHRLPETAAPPSPRPPTVRASLPDVPRWRVLPLLPKLAIVVGDDASPVVQRIAEEIYETYGST